MGAGQRGHQDAAGFGLPPGVDDRATFPPTTSLIPIPGFGIDRLADGARASGCSDRMFRQTRCPVPSARGWRWGRCRTVDLVLFADLPEARGVRVGRHAFKHQGRRAIGQRAVDDIAVAGDPAHIGGAPVDIAVVVIETYFMGHRGIDKIAAVV